MAQQNLDGSWNVQGRRLTFPVPVAQASLFGALYAASAGAAARILRPAGVTPVRIAGRSLVGVFSITYDPVPGNVLGDYHEIGFGFVVRAPDGSARPFIHQLPVTQGFTREAGEALWGFPKWVGEISTSSGRSGGRSTLSLAGRHVLSMSTSALLGLALPALRRPRPLTMFTVHDGTPSLVPISGTVAGVRFRLGGSTVIPGQGHPMADELAALGFPHVPALASFVVRRFAADLGPTRTVQRRDEVRLPVRGG